MTKDEKKNLIQIGVSLEEEVVETIDRLSRRLKMSRSEFAKNLILIGLDDARLMERFGVFKIRELVRDLMKMERDTEELEVTW